MASAIHSSGDGVGETRDDIRVVGTGGLHGTVHRPAAGWATAATVELMLADGRRVVVPTRLLQPQADGTYYLPAGPGDLVAPAPVAPAPVAPAPVAHATHATPVAPVVAATGATTTASTAVASASGGVGVMPLVAEQLEVHKRRVETGKVRVSKTVQTEEQTVDLSTVREEVVVERVPVERFVTAAPPVRQEGDTTVISVVEEVLVVEKRLMVREEVRLTTRRTETHDPRTVTLRKEVAHVERVAAD